MNGFIVEAKNPAVRLRKLMFVLVSYDVKTSDPGGAKRLRRVKHKRNLLEIEVRQTVNINSMLSVSYSLTVAPFVGAWMYRE